MKKVALILFLLSFLLILCGIYFSLVFSKDISYPYIGVVSENMLAVSDGDKYGYYDLEENHVLLDYPVISQMKGEEGLDLSSLQYVDGVAPYTKKEKFGLIDSSGKVLLNANFDFINVYNKEHIIVFDNSGYYIINYKNEKQIDGVFDEVVRIDDTSLFLLTDSVGTTLYDAESSKILLKDLLNIQYFKSSDNENYVITGTDVQNIKKNYFYQHKTDSLKELIGTENLYPGEFANNQIVFLDDFGPVLIYDLSSNQIKNIDGDYVWFGTFNSNLALVYDNQLNAGFVDAGENLVIPYSYKDGTTNFNIDGISIVNNGTNYGAIDTNNRVIIPFQYKDISFLKRNIYIITDSNYKFFLYNLSYEKVISKSYDFIDSSNIDSGLLVVEKNKQFGVIDMNGKEVIEPLYQDIILDDEYIIVKLEKNKYRIYNTDDV